MTAIALRRPPSLDVPTNWKRRLAWIPLPLILAAQVTLALRIITRPPSLDEARYIYAGHQLLNELLHGGGTPYYDTYFSGAPDFYPPLAAMADRLGGLIEVRLMSLLFVVGATVLLYMTARHLFGQAAGLLAASMFAVNGLTRFVGTYANYDGLALLLLSAAAYFAVRSADPEAKSRWLLLVPVALLLANTAKYASLLFDPVVLMLASYRLPWRQMIRRVLILGGATTGLLVLAAALAGGAYIKGVFFSTLGRKAGTNIVFTAQKEAYVYIVSESGRWIGLVVLLAMISLIVALATREKAPTLRLLGVMIVAGLLVTLEAIHLHTDESMIQHDDFSAWFSCIATGYSLGMIYQMRHSLIRHLAGGTAFAGVIGATAIFGLHFVPIQQRPTGMTSQLEALLKPYLSVNGGRYLISGGSGFHLIYQDKAAVPWFDLTDDNYLKYPIPGRGGDSHGRAPGKVCTRVLPGCVYLEGNAAYVAAIQAHWFAVISIGSRYNPQRLPADRVIQQTVEHTRGYVLLSTIGGGPTWVYAPDYSRKARSSSG